MKKEKIYMPFARIGVYFILNVLISVPFAFFLNKSLIVDNILLLIIDILLASATCFLLKDKLKNVFKNFKKNLKKNLKTIFKYWGIGFFLMMITNLIINVFIIKEIAPNEEANRSIIDMYPFYATMTIGFITPITEEMLFRLNFQGAIISKRKFILTTGILFGLLHVITSLSNPIYLLYLIPYSILGFTFGLIFYDTNNIISSIMAHSLHNCLSLLIIFLGV